MMELDSTTHNATLQVISEAPPVVALETLIMGRRYTVRTVTGISIDDALVMASDLWAIIKGHNFVPCPGCPDGAAEATTPCPLCGTMCC